jgi:hypothetical protein
MSVLMAKKKPTADGSRNPLRPQIALRLPDEVRVVVEALADREHRAMANLCAVLVQEALVTRGLWPPADTAE